MEKSAKWGAEFLGTFLLVLGGCGSAIFAAKALGTAKGTVGIGGADLGVAGIVNSGIGYLGFMMGPPVIGAIAHTLGLPLALSMVAGFTIISALLARRAMRAVEH